MRLANSPKTRKTVTFYKLDFCCWMLIPYKENDSIEIKVSLFTDSKHSKFKIGLIFNFLSTMKLRNLLCRDTYLCELDHSWPGC